MDLKETGILGSDIRRHWYYSSKARAVKRLLAGTFPSRILDVGAGSGFFSRHLLDHTDASEAWCVDISYERDADERAGVKAIHYRRAVDVVDADVVLLMDVLEHVDDDVGLLREYAAKVPVGCRFLVTVPAFQFLWSGHDDFLEHRCRYTLPQLEEVIRNAGLSLKHGAYYFGAVFPIAAILRAAQRTSPGGTKAQSQLRRHSPVTNAILKLLCALELPFFRANRIAGLSVFCLAEKRSPSTPASNQ